MASTARNFTTTTDSDLIASGRQVLGIEAAALTRLERRLTADDLGAGFAAACRLLLDCSGRIVVLGMGKSGHIGNKLAATLASTGSPAFFVHPAEASHGDLGMMTAGDVVMALSNSGETAEIVTLLALIKRRGLALLALTGNPCSTLARAADVHLDVGVQAEACPLGLAPTASTTAALAVGDAIAVALLSARGFSSDDFARSHPGGRLGRRLLVRVEDIMHRDDDVPQVMQHASVRQALLEMTRKRLGITIVTDTERRVLGVFTDGDLARALDRPLDLHQQPISGLMTSRCTTVGPQLLAAEALLLMETRKINALPVVQDDGRLIGAFNMHDLLAAGVM